MADHRLTTYDELDPERVGEPRYFSYLCDQEHGLIEAVGAHLPEMLR